MRGTYKLFYFSLLCIFFICCRENKKNVQPHCEGSDVDSIYIAFLNYYHEPAIAIRESDLWRKPPPVPEKKIGLDGIYYIDYRGALDTTIIDCEIIKEIELRFDNLKTDPNPFISYIDARVAGIIYYKNGVQQTFGIDNAFSAYISKNGVPQFKDLEFIYTVKKYIGYYSWFSREDLESMHELHDPSFTRDSIYITKENNPILKVD